MRETTEAAGGERRGPMLVFKDADGLRHAVRVTAVIAASDLDEARDATMLQLPNARYVVVREGLDKVLGWFSGWPASPGLGGRQDAEVARLRQRLAGVTAALKSLVAILREEGLMSADPFAGIREPRVAEDRCHAAGHGQAGDKDDAGSSEGCAEPGLLPPIGLADEPRER